MDVRGLDSNMALKLPRYVRVQGCADITRRVAPRRDRHEPRHPINRIVSGIPPKPVSASVNRQGLGRLNAEVRMDANNVLWSDEAGVVEIPRFEVERVESFQLSILLVMVAAGDSRLEP